MLWWALGYAVLAVALTVAAVEAVHAGVIRSEVKGVLLALIPAFASLLAAGVCLVRRFSATARSKMRDLEADINEQ
jgi:hypothetical protein